MKQFALFALCCLFFSRVIAQNLVPNPSFEDHRPLECQSCHLAAGRFPYTLPHWQRLNTQPWICDCAYEKKGEEHTSGICYYEDLQPQDGCTMLEMRYQPMCLDFEHETRGCASYVGTSLTQPLELGQQYEVSFWLYINRVDDPDFPEHIGMMLFPEAFRNPNGAMIAQDELLIDTVRIKQWYQVSWRIQPTCPLQFLVIGVFRGANGPAVHSRYHQNIYFIDQVSVRPVPTPINSAKEVAFFCKPKALSSPTTVPVIAGADVYFASGTAVLTEDAQLKLDSFALRARTAPKVAFLISGHTDSVGSDHLELSQQRLENVLTYLEEKHQLSRLRFTPLAMGDQLAVAGNEQEAGRKLNRRVEIRQFDARIQTVIYRNLLEYLFQRETDGAMQALNIWLHLADRDELLLPLFDPRLEQLHHLRGWPVIASKIEQRYKQLFSRPELAYTLATLWAEDQRYRTLKFYIENLNVYLPEQDSSYSKWDVNFESSVSEQLESDQNHLARLLPMLEQEGWVKKSEVGERAAKAVFLILQHSMDEDLLTRYLPFLKERCLEGETEWILYANMYDRLQTIKNLPQRFGTQFKISKDGTREMFPLEDPKQVNQWRNEIGLPPLENN
ncbi:MAG: OmpA family protein [Saprospiraceae bacterium]|nr:OmpA family protein [Lewinella sp.]